MNYCIFHVEGGLGKNVAATAVARAIKNNHPNRELVVVCSYPEVFMHLPFIHRVFRIGVTPYFFQEFIEGNESLIFKHEPYFTSDHIYKQLPLIENWCKLYGLKYNGEMPELAISKRIRDFVAIKFRMTSRQKPIMLLQTNGGMLQGQSLNYAWTRDIPMEITQKVVDKFSKKYHVLQVCRNQENVANGAEGIFEPMPNLELFALLLLSEKRLLIDSCLQHAAAAFNMESTVLWIGSPAKVFGYDMHTNIQANEPKNKPKLPDSYLFDYDFEGKLHDYPYGEKEKLFDVDEVISSLD